VLLAQLGRLAQSELQELVVQRQHLEGRVLPELLER
jgi:hypothetical protein